MVEFRTVKDLFMTDKMFKMLLIVILINITPGYEALV
jgi:hypothetical protein